MILSLLCFSGCNYVAITVALPLGNWWVGAKHPNPLGVYRVHIHDWFIHHVDGTQNTQRE